MTDVQTKKLNFFFLGAEWFRFLDVFSRYTLQSLWGLNTSLQQGFSLYRGYLERLIFNNDILEIHLTILKHPDNL
jgi:hypothetical protein